MWLTKISAQLLQKRWEIVVRTMKGTAESLRRSRITTGGAAEAQVDPAGEQRFERAELLCNGKRRMIRQHDAPGTNADSRSRICDVTDQNRSRRAGDPPNVVVFREPESPVTQGFCSLGQHASVAESFLSRSSLS
jgi:hypothetical protein